MDKWMPASQDCLRPNDWNVATRIISYGSKKTPVRPMNIVFVVVSHHRLDP